MCCGGKSSGSGSSGNRGRYPAPKEKPKQSGEDSDESASRTKKRKDPSREISCAEAAREEVECLLGEPEPKKPAQKQPEKMAPAPPRSTAAERQRIIEENRKDAEAAQKIVDDQKEKAKLEEENKN